MKSKGDDTGVNMSFALISHFRNATGEDQPAQKWNMQMY